MCPLENGRYSVKTGGKVTQELTTIKRSHGSDRWRQGRVTGMRVLNFTAGFIVPTSKHHYIKGSLCTLLQLLD